MILFTSLSSAAHSMTVSDSWPKEKRLATSCAHRHSVESNGLYNLPIAKPATSCLQVMERITIIGSSGSGKSTLARHLGHCLQIPIVHLDKHFWHPGWVPTERSIWTNRVEKMVQAPTWIIDGNYRYTLDIRLQAADTIIFLDMPRLLCIGRAIKRRLQYMYYDRPDIASGCDEQLFDPSLFNFLRRIWNYPYRARPDVVCQLKQVRPQQQVIWLRSPQAVAQFMRSTRTGFLS